MPHFTSLKAMQRGLAFFNITGIVQKFGEETFSTFLKEKRRRHGLIYVNCAQITVTLPDGRAFFFARHSLFYLPKYANYSISFSGTDENDCSDVQITFNLQAPDGTEYFFAAEPTLLLEETPAKVVNNMFQIANYSISLCYPTFPISRAFGEMMETVSNHLWLPELSDIRRSRVFPAVCYLDKHIEENISVAQLAKMCVMNENRFRFEFKRDTGKTPVQYKLENKIGKAKELIQITPDIPTQRLVESLGFFDDSYFYKTFYKVTGMTLKAYRRSVKTESSL